MDLAAKTAKIALARALPPFQGAAAPLCFQLAAFD